MDSPSTSFVAAPFERLTSWIKIKYEIVEHSLYILQFISNIKHKIT